MKVSMRANWAKSLILSNDFENVGSTFPSLPLFKINNAYDFLLLLGSLQQVKRDIFIHNKCYHGRGYHTKQVWTESLVETLNTFQL